jgi:rRNA-processing protein FCF1
MSRKVVIDTNGFMIPGQFGIDLFSELERLGFDTFLITRASVRELERICSHGRGKDASAARIALSLLGRCTVIEKEGFADDMILDLAVDMNAPVLSNDIELKKRLCSKGVTIVQLRGKTHLSL